LFGVTVPALARLAALQEELTARSADRRARPLLAQATLSILAAAPARDPRGKKEDYRALPAKTSKLFKQHGALSVVEAWGDDVSPGKTTDFLRRPTHVLGRLSAHRRRLIRRLARAPSV